MTDWERGWEGRKNGSPWPTPWSCLHRKLMISFSGAKKVSGKTASIAFLEAILPTALSCKTSIITLKVHCGNLKM